MDPLKKALKWTGIVVGGVLAFMFILVEIFLVFNDETSAKDVVAVVRVNFGADYVELSKSGTGDQVSQTIMVKDHQKLSELFTRQDCFVSDKTTRFFTYYKTKSGKEFCVTEMTKTLFYSTYILEGITIEELNE